MRSGMTRRSALKTAALATTALVAAPYVRGANAAGKLSIGFWDHWVPNANKATEDAVNAWAEKEKVEVSMDFIPSQGNKNLITIAAESQAKSGHDVFAFPAWYVHAYQELLVDVSDVMERSDQAERRRQRHRELSRQGRTASGSRCRRPIGSQIKGPCSRIDLMKQHAGIDVQALYPAGQAPKADSWTYDTYPEGGGSLPEGRVRDSASASARRRTRSTPRARSSTASAPNSSTPRATSPSRPMRCARRSNTASRSRSSIRPMHRRGTTRRTTSGSSRAAAR